MGSDRDEVLAVVRRVAGRLDGEGDLGRSEADHLRTAARWVEEQDDLSDELRGLLDVAHLAVDALASTTIRPADVPAWLWDVAGEAHRVGSHGEAPAPERTAQLAAQVEAAYDGQSTDPDWWEGRVPLGLGDRIIYDPKGHAPFLDADDVEASDE